jgi:hypothetical protein
MTGDKLLTLVRESFSAVRMDTPAEHIIGRGQMLRTRRKVLTAAAVLPVAAAVLIVIGVLGSSSGQAPHHPAPATLAAWTVTRHANGIINVTIRELRDPAGLQRTLRANGVPANVVFLGHSFTPTTSSTAIPQSCRAPHLSDKANADLQAKIMPQPGPFNPISPGSIVLMIRPSAIPHGIGLFIEAYAASPGSQSGQGFAMQTDLVQASQQCTGS